MYNRTASRVLGTAMTVIVLLSALTANATKIPDTNQEEDSVAEQLAKLPQQTEILDPQRFHDIVVLPAEDAQGIEDQAVNGGGICYAPIGIEVTCEDGTGYTVVQGDISTMRLFYSWTANIVGNASARVIGRGYEYGREYWGGGGFMMSGRFSVPWYGSGGIPIMSTKKVRVMSSHPGIGVEVFWN